MAGNVLEEFFIAIGVDSKDLTAGEKAVTSAVLSMQKSLGSLVGSFDNTTKKAGDSQKRLGQSTDKLGKDLQSSVSKINNFFDSIKNNVLALAGISLTMGGAMAWIGNTTKGLVDLGVQSKALGISAKEVDGWGRAFKVAGSSAESALQSLKAIQDAKNSLQLGRPTAFFQAAEMLNNMTGSPKRIDWQNADAGSIQKQIAGMLRKVSKEQALYFGGQLGYDQAAIMGMRSGQIQSDQSKFAANSGVTDEQIRKAKEQAAALEEMKQKMDALKLAIYEKIIPALTEWIGWINSNWPAIQQFFLNCFTYIHDVAVAANKLAQDLGGWKVIIGAIIGLKFAAWLIAVAAAAKGAMGGGLLGKAGLVGAAGAGGYALGSVIYDKLLSDTKASDVIGGGIAKTLALFGNEEARNAVSINEGRQKAVNAVKEGVKDAPVVARKSDRDAVEERGVWADVKGLLKAIVGNTDSLKNQQFGFGNNGSGSTAVTPTTSKEAKANQSAVFKAMRKAGFTQSQAAALTAQVGRENSYNTSLLYGTHRDAANNLTNMGMLSWQGSRARELKEFLAKRGLIDKNGNIVKNESSLIAQAEFIKKEIETNPAYAATRNMFANNPNANPSEYSKTLGKNYVGWAYGQNRLKSGQSFDWQKHLARESGYLQEITSSNYYRAIAGNNYTLPKTLARPSNTSTTHIQNMTVQSTATSMNQLTQDIGRQTRLITANAFQVGGD